MILLLLGIIGKLREAADPFSGAFIHPVVMVAILLVPLCLLIGCLIRSAPGRRARRALEQMLFEKLPGYRLVKAFAGRGPMAEAGGRAMRPALATIEEGHCPALPPDGRLVVFVPGSPAPMSGALCIFTPDRVTCPDVPLLAFMKANSSWGLSLRELKAHSEAARPTKPTPIGRTA